jgi:hypothetical protein
VKIPQGEQRTFTFKWNGRPANSPYRLKLEPGRLAETFAALKAAADEVQAVGAELDVLSDFAEDLTIREATAAAAVLRELDSPGVKVNGFADGQLFYLAYLPRESWRERKERLCQPPEVYLASDGTARVIEIKEDWSGDDDVLEPKLIVTEHPRADLAAAAKLASKLAGRTSTMLVFAAADAKLSAGAQSVTAGKKDGASGAGGAALASSVAAIGIGVGMVGAAAASLMAAVKGMGPWQAVAAVVAIILVVSLPSVILTWFKLRRRDLGAILNAGGWAVNRQMRFSMKLARGFTKCARTSEWWLYALLLLILLGLAGYTAWTFRGRFCAAHKDAPPPAAEVQVNVQQK